MRAEDKQTLRRASGPERKALGAMSYGPYADYPRFPDLSALKDAFGQHAA
jgi:hypothetical protein